MGVGELLVSLRSASQVRLTEKQITKATLFHRMIFRDVLQLNKRFLIANNENKEYSYLVVPIMRGK